MKSVFMPEIIPFTIKKPKNIRMKKTPKALTFLMYEVSLGKVIRSSTTKMMTHEYERLNDDQFTERSTVTSYPKM